MRYFMTLWLCVLLLSPNLWAVDATLTIRTDVEKRGRVGIVDASSAKNQTFFDILLSDLKITGHFLADKKYYTGTYSSTVFPPALKGQEYILKYKLQAGTNLAIRLLQASNGQEIFSKTYKIAQANKMPFLAHKAIADINAILKYPSVAWLNRYVVYAIYSTSGHSEIRLSDYTFNYQKTIMRGGLNIFVKWADKAQRNIYYTSFKGLLPTLYKLNIYTGAKRRIASSEGMIVCSDVSKNASKILLTMAPNGQTDIYEMNLATHSTKRVTTFQGIDVNGRYIDNESRIAFVSNRLGYPNIFTKSLNGAGASQAVYHGHKNASCDAYGTKIVYSSRESNSAFGANTFNLYLTSGSGTQPLTSRGNNQFPRFSSDGSVVLFLKELGNSTSIGYSNLISKQSLLFPFYGKKVQSIDW